VQNVKFIIGITLERLSESYALSESARLLIRRARKGKEIGSRQKLAGVHCLNHVQSFFAGGCVRSRFFNLNSRGVAMIGLLAALSVLALAQTAQPAPKPPASAVPQTPAAKPGTTPAAPAQAAPGPAKAPVAPPAAKQPPEPPPPPPIPSPLPPFPNIPAAQLLWSTVLDKDAPAPLLPDSEAARMRSAAIAGDRAVAVFEAHPESSRGGRPLTTYRLATVDLATGKVLAQQDLPGQARPALFATDDAHLILQQATLTRLNPDLTESGEKFGDPGKTSGRRAFLPAPDGTALAYSWDSTTLFLDAHTLAPIGPRIRSPLSTAAGKSSLLSTEPVWSNQFPKDLGFIALYDGRSPRLLYRGPCAGHPVFLSADKILTVACAKVTILDLAGRVLKELPVGAAFGAFAGVSRDGSRFAIESSDYPVTDPSYNATELFTIYDAATFLPVATVTPDSLPDARSWSAFSQDGKSFLSGSARKVSLYRIP
jgi:hypothetical protein